MVEHCFLGRTLCSMPLQRPWGVTVGARGRCKGQVLRDDLLPLLLMASPSLISMVIHFHRLRCVPGFEMNSLLLQDWRKFRDVEVGCRNVRAIIGKMVRIPENRKRVSSRITCAKSRHHPLLHLRLLLLRHLRDLHLRKGLCRLVGMAVIEMQAMTRNRLSAKHQLCLVHLCRRCMPS